MMYAFGFIALLVTIFCCVVESDPTDSPSNESFPGQSDLVRSLPNVTLPFGIQDYSSIGHYSGFLEVGEAQLYYWLYRSQSGNWQTDPVVLWISGAPGISSLTAALTEIGSFLMNLNGTLTSNPYSWNRDANLLFIESPVGAGFSISNEPFDYSLNDTETVQFNVGALKSFYLKFPHLLENDFYLSGEGDASLFLFPLAKELVEKNIPQNFKGITIGNGVFNQSQTLSAHLDFLYKEDGKLNKSKAFDKIVKSCCPPTFCEPNSTVNFSFRECETTFATSNEGTFCNRNIKKLLSDLYQTNMHNIDQNCSMSGNPNPICNRFITARHIHKWLNSASVTKALGIEKARSDWVPANLWFASYNDRPLPVLHDHLMFLLRNNIRVLVYYGDRDATVSVYNGYWFLEDLDLDLSPSELQIWNFEDKVAGVQKQFKEGLTFSIVFNAGYSVPVDKPGTAFKMFTDFLASSANSTRRSHTIPFVNQYSAVVSKRARQPSAMEFAYWEKASAHYLQFMNNMMSPNWPEYGVRE